jgi:hypothetical protein
MGAWNRVIVDKKAIKINNVDKCMPAGYDLNGRLRGRSIGEKPPLSEK